mmetsp:Transcript_13103/g.19117  ORF Transcript_13103/g.19117 Transcript_13103/m.19117 type:complete len:284 (+) Transcript_13103:1913-2764(+)|eukprot:CAMPEP_0202430604 /NCGR_PEP_ID=MMETSP1345-20130828/3983_1 /ASSEMBLY_ACC=CAM_ASM_000843 /TAXON_ID=342563 /ORGANISM="Fabrea Fabrea salina" /LENGTH=283 /DNA_ID=CAMNT_0049042117 /DNA_START=1834 /DNA_END=2685 /DNA_ORIENTATION=+
MNKQSVREIFDQISDSVINFLENHPGVTEVEFTERQGIVENLIETWEQENSPYLLPNDIKAFLQITDGLLLKWKIKIKDKIQPLGYMHVNKLKEIVPFNFKSYALRTLGDDPPESDDEEQDVKGFNLDNQVFDGRLGLIYYDTVDSPKVYFQDLSGHWFFIANSFTDYFRLMVMHLGLPHWHYAFTEVGLDTTSQQWFRFLSPERLTIDMKSRNTQIKRMRKQKKDVKKEQVLIRSIRRRRNTSGFYMQETEEDPKRKKQKKSKKKKTKKKLEETKELSKPKK